MKKILTIALVSAAVMLSANTMADSKKSSTALKISSSGEAMHKKDRAKMNANRNLAEEQKTKRKKVAMRGK